MRPDAFGSVPTFSEFSVNFGEFSDFGAGRACAIYRRSPKCALSSHLVVVVVVVVAALVQKTKTGFAGNQKFKLQNLPSGIFPAGTCNC